MDNIKFGVQYKKNRLIHLSMYVENFKAKRKSRLKLI